MGCYGHWAKLVLWGGVRLWTNLWSKTQNVDILYKEQEEFFLNEARSSGKNMFMIVKARRKGSVGVELYSSQSEHNRWLATFEKVVLFAFARIGYRFRAIRLII